MNKRIFMTGGTGYIGTALIPELIERGFDITALVRESSKQKLNPNATPVTGDALNSESYLKYVDGHDTFIHLIGVAHPGPGKKKKFYSVDLVSIEEAVRAAAQCNVRHFVYLSVAQPAPIMHDYIDVRMKGEMLIKENDLNASILRPWYVLGPGHRWPLIFKPLYELLKVIPYTSATAKRLDPVKLKSFINCFVYAVMNPPQGIRIYESQEMKSY